MHDHLTTFSGKTAVITGGTKGIGLDITSAFVTAGYQVFVGARTRPTSMTSLHLLISLRLMFVLSLMSFIFFVLLFKRQVVWMYY